MHRQTDKLTDVQTNVRQHRNVKNSCRCYGHAANESSGAECYALGGKQRPEGQTFGRPLDALANYARKVS